MSRQSVRVAAVPPQAPALRAAGWAGAGALLGFGVVLVALFLTFAQTDCVRCLQATSGGRFAGRLLDGLDGWRLLTLAIAGVVTTGSYLLLAPSRRQTALGSLVLALATGALAIVDAANASTRVLGWPGTGVSDVAHGPGFYLALVGVIAACVFSALMVGAERAARG